MRVLFFGVMIMFLMISCDPPVQAPTFGDETTKEDILGSKEASPNAITIDIYLDATTSMKGFARVPGSSYGKFLDELESALHTSWEKAEIKFFKFGTKIRSITRDEYKSAENNEAFYKEKGILEQTNIDQVIDQTAQDRISMVITDLFQTDGDVLKVVDKLKERCFGKDIDLAILGIKSDYDGIIFDTKVPPFPLNTQGNPELQKAFYAIVFGNGPNIEHLFKTLKGTALKEYVKEDQFTIISSTAAVRDFDAEIIKSKTAKNDRSFRIKKKDKTKGSPITYDISIDDDKGLKPLTFSLKLDKGYYPPIGDMEVRVEKIMTVKGKASESQPTEDLKVKTVTREGETILVEVELQYPPKVDAVSYSVKFNLSKLNAFVTPDWIKGFSSDNPTPTNEPNKTLNLERFVRDLLRATASVNDYKVAKAYLHITTK